MGYYRAGFDVVGVDNKPQPHYPFPFILGDAIDILTRMIAGEKFQASDGNWYGLDDFSAIHASPPCQGYSNMRFLPWLKGRIYPLLIESIRTLLIRSGKKYVIENVKTAPLDGYELCGLAMGLKLIRHRKFESNVFMLFPPCPGHPVIFSGSNTMSKRGMGGGVRGVIDGDAKSALGIDWMTNMEMRQAIPPAYTEFIGKYVLESLA
jgi:DNA (cytosine-5)-methyltransferase 1